jgi:predicted transcriptional regulator
MKSKEILPDNLRLNKSHIDRYEDPKEWKSMKIPDWIYKYHKALETAELEILDYMSRLNSAHQELVIWQQDYKTLNDEYNQLKQTLTDYVETHNTRFKDLCDKYAEISWNIESLAAKNQENDGISNGLFREMVRELLDRDANERYEKALNYLTDNCTTNYLLSLNEEVKQAFKIAAYGNSALD